MILDTAGAVGLLHEVADVIGIVISIPIVYGIIQAVRYTGAIEKSILQVSTELTSFMGDARRQLDRHENEIERINDKLWDGKTERRRHIETLEE